VAVPALNGYSESLVHIVRMSTSRVFRTDIAQGDTYFRYVAKDGLEEDDKAGRIVSEGEIDVSSFIFVFIILP
jgi:hypothetical protein